MPKELTFRLGNKDDLPRISEFRKAFFGYSSIRSHEPEYYDWKCYKNPALPGEIWLAEDGNAVVAIKSMTPKRMKILGEKVIGAETGDTFTHPDYQRQGIFTKLFEVARENGIDGRMSFIYGTPNKNSLPGYIRKLDYAQIPLKLRILVKPLAPKQILQKKLGFYPLASLVSPVVEIASRAIFRIAGRAVSKSNIRITQILSFPDDIDVLWEQTSKNFDIALVRDKNYLEWRYVANPDTYSILIARNQEGAILGYMVTKIGFEEDIPLGYIVDFLTFENDVNVFKKLLVTSLERLYHRKVNLVSTVVVKGSYYYNIFLKFGFIPRVEVPLICYKGELGMRVLSEAYRWHFTLGDTDNI